MRSAIARSALAFLLLSGGIACGDHSVQRGLAPPDETAAPTDAADMKETTKERQGTLENEMERKSAQEFDESQQQEETAPEQAP